MWPRTKAARASMTMRLTLEANTSIATTDEYGHPTHPYAWATTGSSIPCVAWSSSKRMVDDDGKIAIVEVIECIIPRGTEVKDEYRVANIKDRLSTTIFAGPFSIDTIQIQPTHLELVLRIVDSGDNVDL